MPNGCPNSRPSLPREEAPGWRFATYLGDAVYALSEDGQNIHLRLDHHDNDRSEIFLEPQVLEAFDRFRERMRKQLHEDEHGRTVSMGFQKLPICGHDHPALIGDLAMGREETMFSHRIGDVTYVASVELGPCSKCNEQARRDFMSRVERAAHGDMP